MKKNRLIIVGVIVAICGITIFLLMNLSTSIIDYVTIFEAKQRKSIVQVAGWLVKNSIAANEKARSLSFHISDSTENDMEVLYKGVIPSNIYSADKVVVIGKYMPEQSLFQAHKILVKCPTKYEQKL